MLNKKQVSDSGMHGYHGDATVDVCSLRRLYTRSVLEGLLTNTKRRATFLANTARRHEATSSERGGAWFERSH